MGKIYLAQHIHTNKKVAIKTIKTNLLADSDKYDKSEIEERFKREAQTAAQISHENVVEIYDFETAQENFPAYIAMELLEGESLSSILEKEKKLSLERSIELMIQICRGVGNAHKKGFVHRDLKPANLVILPKNNEVTERVKIVDFGIVKIFDPDLTKLTEHGKLLGTPEFMSPEQCNSEETDSRSDVYNLGLIFYLMLSGKMPYYGENLQQWLIHHIMGVPRPLSNDIPNEIAQIIMRSLEKDRERRFKSAIELGDRLTEIKKQRQEKLHETEQQQIKDELENAFEKRFSEKDKNNKSILIIDSLLIKGLNEENTQLAEKVTQLNKELEKIKKGQNEIAKKAIFSSKTISIFSMLLLCLIVGFVIVFAVQQMKAKTYIDSGMQKAKVKNYEAAFSDFDSAVKICWQCQQAYFPRAFYNAEIGNDEQAIIDYTKVIELDQNSSSAYNNRGILYAKKKDYGKALTDYHKAIDLEPRTTNAYRSRGVLYSELGRRDLADADFATQNRVDKEIAASKK